MLNAPSAANAMGLELVGQLGEATRAVAAQGDYIYVAIGSPGGLIGR